MVRVFLEGGVIKGSGIFFQLSFFVLGSWGSLLAEEFVSGAITLAEKKVSLPEGFVMERVFEIPKEMGSWVALTAMGDRKLAAADQYGGVYEISLEEKRVQVRSLDVGVQGIHGLLWFDESLFVVVNELDKKQRGIHRLSDQDGDGVFETKVFFQPMQTGGEHGVHALVPSPDGEWIYFVSGNYNQFSGWDHSWVPEVWGADQLIPSNPDGRGHAQKVKAPAGKVMRFKPDGTEWELVSMGFRNPYDGAFSQEGEFFVYDADMEWDMGMPWYRPTRLCWALPGAEYGWRTGTGKWPSYYEDSLPGVVEFGPGSPTGVVSGRGFRAPARYQRMMFCFDWTFATIYAVELTQEGGGFGGRFEEFLTASGFPLTDGVIGSDGNLYFATGGRKQASVLWRVRYVGDEKTEDAWVAKTPPEPSTQDRWGRFRARTDAELAGLDAVKALLKKETTLEQLNGVIALARIGREEHRKEAFAVLEKLTWGQLSRHEKLTWLRAAGLVMIRLGEITPEEREMILGQIDASFPNQDLVLDAELCRMLCHLKAPRIVARTLARMAEPKEVDIPDWAHLIERNSNYGQDVAKVLRELVSPRDIHYAYCLRVVPGPWKKEQRQQLMNWYVRNEFGKAQKSARLGLKRMREDTLEVATEEERELIAGWGLEVKKDPFADLPQPKGPARTWSVAEMTAVAEDLATGDRENGERMFRACLCATCHRVGVEGGAAGPDLTAVGGRFSGEEFAVAVLEPSREISDQYAFQKITLSDGPILYGRIIDEKDEILVVATHAFDFGQTREVSRADVARIELSPISPMPAALVNQLNEQEMRDLLAYLLKKP